MKARACLSMFLILIISYTGFGKTTSDLTKNSTAITISDYDVDEISIMEIVVDKSDFNINETNSYVFSQSLIIKPEFKIKEAEVDKPFKGQLLIPPLFNNHTIFNIKTSSKLKRDKYLLTYRRARDGINCNLS